MITHYGGFTAFDVLYDTGGHLVDPTAEQEALDYLASPAGSAITDVAMMSHGWNNNIDEARELYSAFFTAVRGILGSQPTLCANGRQLAILGVFWPSKKFADADLIPGGAAALSDFAETRLNAQLDLMQQLFAADPSSVEKIRHAREQIAKLEVSQSAQDDFVFALTSLLPPSRGERDEGVDDAREELNSLSSPGHLVLQRLSAPASPVFPSAGSGSGSIPVGLPSGSGQAASLLTNFGSSIKAAANRLLNYFTYYTMKDRAGIVGRTGVLQTITKLAAQRAGRPNGLRVHLIGHSFGGRLVTSAANALPAGSTVDSMTLLQAAYSHNGLGSNWDNRGHDGAFRGVIAGSKIAGPVLITHSVHDTAVGLAYPLASRILNQTASAIGDSDDAYGGMGRNGAQHTPESFQDVLQTVGSKYNAPPAGKTIRNLNGDGPPAGICITSHHDVAKPEIAAAWLQAVCG